MNEQSFNIEKIQKLEQRVSELQKSLSECVGALEGIYLTPDFDRHGLARVLKKSIEVLYSDFRSGC